MAVDSQKQPVQPRDARIVSLILQSLGVEDYDPKVVHQLLEFAHRKIYIYFFIFYFFEKYYKN
jgi:transcription initiation factor TFIID subunit 9B